MPAIDIKWQFSASVDGGPRVLISDPPMQADAYDVIRVSLPDGTTDKEIDVQPSSDAKQLRLLAITSDRYGDGLTHKVNTTAHKLDGPLLLIGAGAIGLLGTAPETIKLTNNLGEDANLQILVGRTNKS